MNDIRKRRAVRVLFTFVAALPLAMSVRLAHTQQQTQPAQTPAPPSAANYHGVNKLMPTDDVMPGRRRFEAGAHTAWHIHPAGQLLFIEDGVGVVQRRGEAVKVL